MRKEEGFTLIELLIVVIILAILAAIVVFAVGTFAKTSRQNACKTDFRSVQTAQEAYKASSNPSVYADSIDGTGNKLVPTYLKEDVNGNGYSIATASTGVVTVTVLAANSDTGTNQVTTDSSACPHIK
jgi:general secretion pathway protein G